MPITNLPPLRRYMDDKQWSVVGRAIKQAGGQINDGNRLHVDAILDLMRSRMPWRDLDFRYGPWANVHTKYVRWYETGVLLNLTKALFDTGLTEEWRPVFTEISYGISARPGPQIRPLMTQIVVELRRHRDAGGKKKTAKPKLPKPVGTTYKDKKKAYAAKVKEAVAARRGTQTKRLTDADWSYITSRLPEFAEGPQNGARRQIDELMEVMRTNKGWNYMDPKVGTPGAVYARFAKWAAEGLMRRLVKALAELGLTKDWSQFLIAPLPKGETSLKKVIGAEAHAFVDKPKRKLSGKKRAVAKTKAHAAANVKLAKSKSKRRVKAAEGKAKSSPSKSAKGLAKASKTATPVTSGKSLEAPATGKTTGKPTTSAKSAKVKTATASGKNNAKEKTKEVAAKTALAVPAPSFKTAKNSQVAVKAAHPRKPASSKVGEKAAVETSRSVSAKDTRANSRPSGKAKAPASVVAVARQAAKPAKAGKATR